MFNHKCVGLVFRQDELYLLSLCENMNVVSTENENVSPSMNARNKRKRVHDVSSKLWHCRLGHISRERIERLIKKSILPPLEFSNLKQCIDCIKGAIVFLPLIGRPVVILPLFGKQITSPNTQLAKSMGRQKLILPKY